MYAGHPGAAQPGARAGSALLCADIVEGLWYVRGRGGWGPGWRGAQALAAVALISPCPQLRTPPPFLYFSFFAPSSTWPSCAVFL